ncbi:MAG: hypothetical protein GC152_11505 [Alphaproteobacteria bacterium]|nr:hypothetical protein [Alphaproteobacteria bacterium]
MKSWFFTLLVVLFGMGQVACACTAGAEAGVQVAVVEQAQIAEAGHECHHDTRSLKTEAPAKSQPEDCDHCKSGSGALQTAAADLMPAQIASAPVIAILPSAVVFVAAEVTRAPERRLRLWTGPPERTLVTLKVKNLN